MHGSWDMKHERQNYLSFWVIFCPFTTLTTQKFKILKKWKKAPGDIIILHKCTKNHGHICYTIFLFVLGCLLHFYHPPSPSPHIKPKKSQFLKNAWRYHFTYQYHKFINYDQMMYRKKWHIDVGAPPKDI